MTAADIPNALRWDVSHARRTLRGQPAPLLHDALRMESQRRRPRKRLTKWLISRIFPQPPMLPVSPSPNLPISESPTQQHGGRRQPGPGKKLGRPTKQPKAKAICTTITLSSPKTLKTLQSRAKRAKLRPGAYIERELKL